MSSTKRAVLSLISDCTSRTGHVAFFCSASAKDKVHVVTTPAGRSGGRDVAGRSGDRDAAATEVDVAEMARAGVVGAVETGLKLGEMAKQAVDATWDATRTTAESVRDTVAGSYDDNTSDYRSDGGRRSDEHVEDLRRRARDVI